MRWTTTAVLAVLFLGLGAFYYVYEIRQAPEREKAAAAKDRLFKDVEAKDIEEVVIKRGGETIRLKRSGDAWSLVAPVQARAESRPVEDLTSSLAIARIEREIEAAPTKLADFGLDPPALELTFKAKGQERGVRVGAKNPTGIWVYAQETGKPAVFLASESILRDAQKSVTDFRDKTVLAFERKDVKGLEVKGSGGQTIVAATLKGTDEWELTAPALLPGDRTAIDGLLDKVRNAKVKEFVADAPTSLAPYGLDRPARLTVVIGAEKDRATRTLLVGKPLPDKKAVYAQREGEATVLLLDDTLATAVPTSADALRDRTVLAFDRMKLQKLELESAKGTVILALEGDRWRITAPVALPADETAMGQLLGSARDLRAKEFVEAAGQRLAAFGLDQPAVRLSVWEKDGKDPKTLLLAPAKGREGAYATTTGTGGSAPVTLVDAKALTDLARGVQDLRDHAVFPAFDTRDVVRVEVRRGEQTLTLERKGEDDWRLVSPKQGKAQPGKASDLVWALRNLRWRELVAEQGWAAGPYGLEPPSATITLGGKDGKTVAALAVGRKGTGETTFVRVPGQPALYAVESPALGPLPASPEDLLQ